MTTKDIQINMPSGRLSLYDFLLVVVLVFVAGSAVGAMLGPFAILVSSVVAVAVIMVKRLVQAPKKAES